MTADERINALLERAGCAVMVVKSDAPPTPERYMAYLIDRLEVALENALNERDFAADTVRNITALDVAPVVHARWIRDDIGHTRCSNCQSRLPFRHCYDEEDGYEWDDEIDETPWCMYCGARMDGEENAAY